MNIAVVIPTIRPDDMKAFKKAWSPLFKKHDVILITVFDGKKPTVICESEDSNWNFGVPFRNYSLKEIMGEYSSSFKQQPRDIENSPP